jgi:hypothetical protein
VACSKNEAAADVICGAQSAGDTVRTRHLWYWTREAVNKKESHRGILTKPRAPTCGPWYANNKHSARVGLVLANKEHCELLFSISAVIGSFSATLCSAPLFCPAVLAVF